MHFAIASRTTWPQTHAMLIALALVLDVGPLPDSAADAVKAYLWLETIAIEAFGEAWKTKGEAIMKDEV